MYGSPFFWGGVHRTKKEYQTTDGADHSALDMMPAWCQPIVDDLVRCAVAAAGDDVTPEERDLQAQVEQLTSQLQDWRTRHALRDVECLRCITKRAASSQVCPDFVVDTSSATMALARKLVGNDAKVSTVSLYRELDRINDFRQRLEAYREAEWKAGRKAPPPRIMWDNRVMSNDIRHLVVSQRALSLQRELIPPAHDAPSGGLLVAIAYLVVGASAEEEHLLVEQGALPIGFITYGVRVFD